MEGDEVLYQDTSELSSTTSAGLDLENVPMIEDFFNSCLAVFGRSSIPGAHLYFHGDEIFIHGEIDVIRPTGDLLPVFNPVGIEKLCKCDLSGAYTDSFHVAGCGSCLKLFERAFSSPGCLVSLPSDFETPFRDEASPPDTHLLGLNLDGCDTRGPGLFSPLLKRKSAHLGFSTFRVCAVHETHFKGMAFDASTQRQLYAVNGLVVKNCLCALVPEVEMPVRKTAEWDESKHPRDERGRFWYHGSSDKHISTDETHLRPGLDGVVWLTTMYDKAVRFANQTAERHGGTPIIYVVEDKDAPQDPTNFGSEDIRSVNKPVRIYSRGEALHKTVEPTPSVKKTRLSLLRKEGQK
jgi:hypothetical protein